MSIDVTRYSKSGNGLLEEGESVKVLPSGRRVAVSIASKKIGKMSVYLDFDDAAMLAAEILEEIPLGVIRNALNGSESTGPEEFMEAISNVKYLARRIESQSAFKPLASKVRS